MLNRYLRMKQEEKGKALPDRRPYSANSCTHVGECERWRMQILREIGQKVTQIQNAAIGEHRIRDLNDEINKLLREKHHWERRIMDLGGPNYVKTGTKVFDDHGSEIIGSGSGYKYFGEARNLPGVKELLQPPPPPPPRKTRAELYRNVDADYYGYRDDDDGLLTKLEAEAEKRAVEKAIQKWKDQQALKEKLLNRKPDEDVDGEEDSMQTDDIEFNQSNKFVAHVPVPSREDMEKILVEKQKEKLLKEYASDSLIASLSTAEKEVKAVLGR